MAVIVPGRIVVVDYAARVVRLLLGATAHPGGEALTRHLLRCAQLPAGSLVLDLACGAGRTLELLSDAGHLAVGVDVEPRAVRWARRHGAAVVGDAHALPFADGAFDAVVCECAVSTFARPAAAVEEVARVLRPGGTFAMTDVVLDRSRAPADVVRTVDRLTTARLAAEYAQLCDDAGFDVAVTDDRRADALALARRVRRRLSVVGARRAASAARACEDAVRAGTLGYTLLVARRR
jgi:arsenite methyltransferase